MEVVDFVRPMVVPKRICGTEGGPAKFNNQLYLLGYFGEREGLEPSTP
jgi:hypothetical protein